MSQHMPAEEPPAGRTAGARRAAAVLMAAALTYQHASQEANRAITDHLNEALTRDDDDDDGVAGALVTAG